MATEEQSKSASLIMPKTHWHERLNLLNVTVIIFLFLAILSGKSLLANNRQADIGAGIRYFVKNFSRPTSRTGLSYLNHWVKPSR